MKVLIIGSLITIGAGVGIYLLGGLTTLGLTVLIPLFLIVPVAAIGISMLMGAMDGLGDFISGIADKVMNEPVTVDANVAG